MVLCYPVMTNPYTLPPTLPSGTPHFSVLDLKDTFFISFNTQSQNIFVFTWTDPNTQLNCPTFQGFRDSPHLFGQALASDLFSLSLSLQQAFLQVTAVHVPDLPCPFSFYVTGKKAMSLGF